LVISCRFMGEPDQHPRARLKLHHCSLGKRGSIASARADLPFAVTECGRRVG
jgi:hypothetical protein